VGVYPVVSNQCEYLWQKRGVYYFRRKVPNDVQQHYERSQIVICLKTKSKSAAVKASRSIASKLDDFWLQMRISDMDVPASHLLVKGKPKDAFAETRSRTALTECVIAQTECVIVLPIVVILKWLTQPLIKLHLRRQDDMALDMYLPCRLVWNCSWLCRQHAAISILRPEGRVFRLLFSRFV
jgi:hypothetical protein